MMFRLFAAIPKSNAVAIRPIIKRATGLQCVGAAASNWNWGIFALANAKHFSASHNSKSKAKKPHSKHRSKFSKKQEPNKKEGEKEAPKFWTHNTRYIAVITCVGVTIYGVKSLYFTYYSAESLDISKKYVQLAEKTQERIGRFTAKEISKFPFKEKKIFFVLGGPGSGKGSNSKRLVEDFGFVHLSAGDLLREEQKRPGSKAGALIADYIKEGLIVPYGVTINLLQEAMMDNPDKDLFLIDGFPRSLPQAKAFEKLVTTCEKVIFYECPESIMLERLLSRGKTSGRTDDNLESIKKRFAVYESSTRPVVEDFEGKDKLISISCVGTEDEVYAQTKIKISAALGTKQ